MTELFIIETGDRGMRNVRAVARHSLIRATLAAMRSDSRTPATISHWQRLRTNNVEPLCGWKLRDRWQWQ